MNWLRQRNIKVWIIDPQSKLYRGEENANTEFNHWWQIVEDITKRAGVRVTVIVHHTGHSNGASARARGASAMGGNPDVLISYWHNVDSMLIRPPDNKRYLEAFGRNVEVHPLVRQGVRLDIALPANRSGHTHTPLGLAGRSDESGERRLIDELKKFGRELRNFCLRRGKKNNVDTG